MAKCLYCERDRLPNSKLLLCASCRGYARRRDKRDVKENIARHREITRHDSLLMQLIDPHSVPASMRTSLPSTKLIPLHKLFGKPIKSRRDPVRLRAVS